jgi:hypothetical protein
MLQHVNLEGKGSKDGNNLHLNSIEVNQKIQEHKKILSASDFYKPDIDKEKNNDMALGLPRIFSAKKELNNSDQDLAMEKLIMEENNENQNNFQPKVYIRYLYSA